MPSEHMLEQVIVWGSDWVSWKTFFPCLRPDFVHESKGEPKEWLWEENLETRCIKLCRLERPDFGFNLCFWQRCKRHCRRLKKFGNRLASAWPKKSRNFPRGKPFSAVKLNFVRSPASKSESTWYRKGNRRFLLLPERGKKLQKVI